MPRISEIKPGDKFKWSGKILRVNNLWQTKDGATARLSFAQKEQQKRPKKSPVKRSDAIKPGVYLRLNMKGQVGESPDYARVRYIMSVCENTIVFREQWKSERESGSFERTEDWARFKEFFDDSEVITTRQYQRLFDTCFNEKTTD